MSIEQFIDSTVGKVSKDLELLQRTVASISDFKDKVEDAIDAIDDVLDEYSKLLVSRALIDSRYSAASDAIASYASLTLSMVDSECIDARGDVGPQFMETQLGPGSLSLLIPYDGPRLLDLTRAPYTATISNSFVSEQYEIDGHRHPRGFRLRNSRDEGNPRDIKLIGAHPMWDLDTEDMPTISYKMGEISSDRIKITITYTNTRVFVSYHGGSEGNTINYAEHTFDLAPDEVGVLLHASVNQHVQSSFDNIVFSSFAVKKYGGDDGLDSTTPQLLMRPVKTSEMVWYDMLAVNQIITESSIDTSVFVSGVAPTIRLSNDTDLGLSISSGTPGSTGIVVAYNSWLNFAYSRDIETIEAQISTLIEEMDDNQIGGVGALALSNSASLRALLLNTIIYKNISTDPLDFVLPVDKVLEIGFANLYISHKEWPTIDAEANFPIYGQSFTRRAEPYVCAGRGWSCNVTNIMLGRNKVSGRPRFERIQQNNAYTQFNSQSILRKHVVRIEYTVSATSFVPLQVVREPVLQIKNAVTGEYYYDAVPQWEISSGPSGTIIAFEYVFADEYKEFNSGEQQHDGELLTRDLLHKCKDQYYWTMAAPPSSPALTHYYDINSRYIRHGTYGAFSAKRIPNAWDLGYEFCEHCASICTSGYDMLSAADDLSITITGLEIRVPTVAKFEPFPVMSAFDSETALQFESLWTQMAEFSDRLDTVESKVEHILKTLTPSGLQQVISFVDGIAALLPVCAPLVVLTIGTSVLSVVDSAQRGSWLGCVMAVAMGPIAWGINSRNGKDPMSFEDIKTKISQRLNQIKEISEKTYKYAQNKPRNMIEKCAGMRNRYKQMERPPDVNTANFLQNNPRAFGDISFPMESATIVKKRPLNLKPSFYNPTDTSTPAERFLAKHNVAPRHELIESHTICSIKGNDNPLYITTSLGFGDGIGSANPMQRNAIAQDIVAPGMFVLPMYVPTNGTKPVLAVSDHLKYNYYEYMAHVLGQKALPNGHDRVDAHLKNMTHSFLNDGTAVATGKLNYVPTSLNPDALGILQKRFNDWDNDKYSYNLISNNCQIFTDGVIGAMSGMPNRTGGKMPPDFANALAGSTFDGRGYSFESQADYDKWLGDFLLSVRAPQKRDAILDGGRWFYESHARASAPLNRYKQALLARQRLRQAVDDLKSFEFD